MKAQRLGELLLDMHRDEAGGATVEYGIIAAGLAIPAIIGLGAIIAAVSGTLTTTMSGLFNYMTQ
ncbi:MAG: Flp family type IVb pilin [Vulcanimicrobiaceae bacterium]